MPTNYKDSAQRHMSDAEYLWVSGSASRLPNASQLFGMSAECALKAVLIGLGLPTKPDGGVDDHRKYGHLPKLWNEFATYAAGQLGGRYAGLLASGMGASPPFFSWDVSDRYAADAWLAPRHAHFTDHRTAARDSIALLELAIQDGLVLQLDASSRWRVRLSESRFVFSRRAVRWRKTLRLWSYHCLAMLMVMLRQMEAESYCWRRVRS